MVELAIDGQVLVWKSGDPVSLLTVKENQRVKISVHVFTVFEDNSTPVLSIEDYSIPLYKETRNQDEGGSIVFSSSPEKIFRECFGSALLRLYIGGDEYIFPFDVLVTKLTAARAERMIRYLSAQREEIIRVCMSRTTRISGIKESGKTDPETVLSAGETIIGMLSDHRYEIQQQLRSKLIPAKVPGWRVEQSGGLIDPAEVVFNIDSLRPSEGDQDIVLLGRTYSASAIDTTALVRDRNVFENVVVLGGIYSIRRVIQSLMCEIEGAFKERQVAAYDKEYQSLGDLLIRLGGGAMYERCVRLINSAENLIRFMEEDCGVKYLGDMPPRITPYVRSSRLYRNIFEQYASWYSLGSPSIEGGLFVIKLRSISKIFEFFVLFRIFDYLIKCGWEVTDFKLSDELDQLVPNSIEFHKKELRVVLSYEPQIFTFSGRTRNKELVKLDHPRRPGNRWMPDYVLRLEDPLRGLVRYLVLDAKYSNPYWVETSHLREIYDKYYEYMGVYDAESDCLSRSDIFGVFAIFPEALDATANAVNIRFAKFGLDGRGPTMIPMVAGLPIGFDNVALMEKWLDKVFDATSRSLKYL